MLHIIVLSYFPEKFEARLCYTTFCALFKALAIGNVVIWSSRGYTASQEFSRVAFGM